MKLGEATARLEARLELLLTSQSDSTQATSDLQAATGNFISFYSYQARGSPIAGHLLRTWSSAMRMEHVRLPPKRYGGRMLNRVR